MGLYENQYFPQTNAREINLDWILRTVKESAAAAEKVESAYKSGELTGRNFAILGTFATLDELKATVPEPQPGDAYGIGAESPYIVYMWVKNEWLDLGNLSGPAGEPGAPGTPGTPGEGATITIGETTTLAPGNPATVINTGTYSAAVLNFGIPRGNDGAKGADGVGVPSAGKKWEVLGKNTDNNFDTTWLNIGNIVYPVGSVFITFDGAIATPNDYTGLFSPLTVWEELENVTLVAKGDAFPMGESGGAKTYKLSQAQLPHIQGSCWGGAGTAANGYGYFRACNGAFQPYNNDGSTSINYPYSPDHADNIPWTTGVKQAQGIQIDIGAGQEIDNMPPYTVCRMFRRIQ